MLGPERERQEEGSMVVAEWLHTYIHTYIGEHLGSSHGMWTGNHELLEKVGLGVLGACKECQRKAAVRGDRWEGLLGVLLLSG